MPFIGVICPTGISQIIMTNIFNRIPLFCIRFQVVKYPLSIAHSLSKTIKTTIFAVQNVEKSMNI